MPVPAITASHIVSDRDSIVAAESGQARARGSTVSHTTGSANPSKVMHSVTNVRSTEYGVVLWHSMY